MRVANEVGVRVQVLQKFPCCCWLLLLDVHVVVVMNIAGGSLPLPPATCWPCDKM